MPGTTFLNTDSVRKAAAHDAICVVVHEVKLDVDAVDAARNAGCISLSESLEPSDQQYSERPAILPFVVEFLIEYSKQKLNLMSLGHLRRLCVTSGQSLGEKNSIMVGILM